MSLLPTEFADLERFAPHWALPTEEARRDHRLASAMTEIRAFHDAMLPRVEAIFAHVDAIGLDALPADAQRLMYLALALAEVTPAVHFFNAPYPTDTIDIRRFVRWDVPNMTPAY